MRVSVLIPSYNHAAFVCEAIDSVLECAYDNVEVVVVDDGSTDDSRTRLEMYRSDQRVCVLTQENKGAHAALNRALELASGDLLYILNSDDVFPPERIPRLTEELRVRPDVAVASSWIQIIDSAGNQRGVKEGWSNLPPWPPPANGPFLSDLGKPELSMLETNFVATTSNIAFRRSLVTDHGLHFLPLRFTHDWEFILSACRHGRISIVPEPLVKYRVHEANTIRKGGEASVGEMRFEIQWTVARHAHALLSQFTDAGYSFEDLVRLAWNSMPSFGCDGILDRLLLMRGVSDDPPASYDDLLDESNAFRRRAIEVLGQARRS